MREKYAEMSELMGIDNTGISTLTVAKKAAGTVRDLLEDLQID